MTCFIQRRKEIQVEISDLFRPWAVRVPIPSDPSHSFATSSHKNGQITGKNRQNTKKMYFNHSNCSTCLSSIAEKTRTKLKLKSFDSPSLAQGDFIFELLTFIFLLVLPIFLLGKRSHVETFSRSSFVYKSSDGVDLVT